MRKLTFSGYLKTYAPYLAGTKSQSMSELARLARTSSRAVEPLLLLAASTGHTDELARHLDDRPELLRELRLLDSLAC